MVVNEEKIVDFLSHCELCKHFRILPEEEPCRGCLASPTNTWSRKPKYFKEKEKKSK